MAVLSTIFYFSGVFVGRFIVHLLSTITVAISGKGKALIPLLSNMTPGAVKLKLRLICKLYYTTKLVQRANN